MTQINKELTSYSDMNSEQTDHPYHKAWCKLLGLKSPSLTTAKVYKSSKTGNQTMPRYSILNKIYIFWFCEDPRSAWTHTWTLLTHSTWLTSRSSRCMECCCFSFSVNILFWQLSRYFKYLMQTPKKENRIPGLAYNYSEQKGMMRTKLGRTINYLKTTFRSDLK